MGNSETKLQTFGYRIIKVAPNSPAKEAGLTEFLDFIIDVENLKDEAQFSSDYDNFHKLIEANEGQVLTLNVYSILTRSTRKVPVVPNHDWEKSDSLLGILVRYEDYAHAHERVLRVKSIKPGTPAASIGLEPENDYILGTSNLLQYIHPIETAEPDDAGPLEVFIYNIERQRVWSAFVTPPKNWDKKGYLGCEFDPEGSDHLPDPVEQVSIRKLSLNKSKNLEGDLYGRRTKNSGSKLPLQDKKERVFTEAELKPPNDAEVQKIRTPGKVTDLLRDSRAYSFDLSKEVTDRRFKELHQKNPRKGSHMFVSQPFMDTGLSSAIGARTLDNLDAPELFSPPKIQSLIDFGSNNENKAKKFVKTFIPQTASLTHTEASVNQGHSDDKAHKEANSLLSVSSEVNEDKTSNTGHNKENAGQHAFFSNKIEDGSIADNSKRLIA